MAIKKFKVNASKQAKSIKKRIIASELLSGIDKLPERGKVITKTIKGDPVVIVGIGDNKYMYKSYLNKASATGDVQFIRNLIKKGEVPANAVKNLGYKLYTSSGSVESACGKKSVKASEDDFFDDLPDDSVVDPNAIANLRKKLADKARFVRSLHLTPETFNECLGEYEQWLADNDPFGYELYQTKTKNDKYMDILGLASEKQLNMMDRGDFSYYVDWVHRTKGSRPNVKAACGKKSVKSGKVAASKKFTAKAAKSIKAAIAGDLTNKDKRSIKTIIDKFFTNDGKSYKSGNWRISAGRYDLVAELYEQDIPVCGILYFAGVYTVESYGYDADDTSKYVADILSDVVSVGVISNEVELKLSTVESTVSAKKFGIKASKSAKKRKAIKASGIQDDIVMYFNGDNVYQGSVYDLADAVENLCYDDEVNAKFQEWCNQFGDPFDFDGSPIDTARVFTDIIIHEAEESPVSEDGQSEFYEDGDGILDFEIFYADEYSIDGAKSIKCSSSDNYNDLDEAMRFRVCNYYDTKFRDLAECKVFDDFDEAVDYAHECLGKGPTTIEDYYVGTVEIDPDEYWDNFDGEFWCTPELANFRDEVWKSMGIGASKSIKCGMSLNLNAKPNYTDWVLRGYKFDGEDVTTLRVDFQDDVKKAVMDMFSDPDIETVDLYKIPTEQETTGVFEDEEYFSTITRDDINASTDITAALDKKSDINDEQYNQALADEVADMLRADGFEDIEVSVAPEAISFFINDEVMFVQPTNMITPNMADIYDDCTELFNAVKEAATDKMWKLYDDENKAMRDAWEDPDIDDPDYATRAVTLSRKAKGKDISAAEDTIDIDDLDYISGDDEQEDWGYGFDSNGEPVTESMVEELERIANEILEKSNLAKIDEYVTIDDDSFDYYVASPWVTETFIIKFDITTDNLDMMSFVLPDAKWLYGYNDYLAKRIDELNFHIYVKNGEVERVELVDHTVRDIQDGKYDVEKLEAHIAELAAPVAMDIYNGTTNI